MDGTEKSHDGYYTFTYNGTDDTPENEINYKIDGPTEGESGSFSLNNTNEYSGKMKMTGGIPSDSDRNIEVTITWNGRTEMTTLNKVK
jgi:hypothetical protein